MQRFQITDADALLWELHLAGTSAPLNVGDPGTLDPDLTRSDIGGYGGPGAED
jgi:hypothetical protein